MVCGAAMGTCTSSPTLQGRGAPKPRSTRGAGTAWTVTPAEPPVDGPEPRRHSNVARRHAIISPQRSFKPPRATSSPVVKMPPAHNGGTVSVSPSVRSVSRPASVRTAHSIVLDAGTQSPHYVASRRNSASGTSTGDTPTGKSSALRPANAVGALPTTSRQDADSPLSANTSPRTETEQESAAARHKRHSNASNHRAFPQWLGSSQTVQWSGSADLASAGDHTAGDQLAGTHTDCKVGAEDVEAVHSLDTVEEVNRALQPRSSPGSRALADARPSPVNTSPHGRSRAVLDTPKSVLSGLCIQPLGSVTSSGRSTPRNSPFTGSPCGSPAPGRPRKTSHEWINSTMWAPANTSESSSTHSRGVGTSGVRFQSPKSQVGRRQRLSAASSRTSDPLATSPRSSSQAASPLSPRARPGRTTRTSSPPLPRIASEKEVDGGRSSDGGVGVRATQSDPATYRASSERASQPAHIDAFSPVGAGATSARAALRGSSPSVTEAAAVEPLRRTRSHGVDPRTWGPAMGDSGHTVGTTSTFTTSSSGLTSSVGSRSFTLGGRHTVLATGPLNTWEAMLGDEVPHSVFEWFGEGTGTGARQLSRAHSGFGSLTSMLSHRSSRNVLVPTRSAASIHHEDWSNPTALATSAPRNISAASGDFDDDSRSVPSLPANELAALRDALTHMRNQAGATGSTPAASERRLAVNTGDAGTEGRREPTVRVEPGQSVLCDGHVATPPTSGEPSTRSSPVDMAENRHTSAAARQRRRDLRASIVNSARHVGERPPPSSPALPAELPVFGVSDAEDDAE